MKQKQPKTTSDKAVAQKTSAACLGFRFAGWQLFAVACGDTPFIKCQSRPRQRYRRGRPEQTLWYRIVQTHFATWLDLASGERGAEYGAAPPSYVERTFRRYLECGILAHGFARAYCDICQHDFLIAYSCKCRGVCPSCNTRRIWWITFSRRCRCGNCLPRSGTPSMQS